MINVVAGSRNAIFGNPMPKAPLHVTKQRLKAVGRGFVPSTPLANNRAGADPAGGAAARVVPAWIESEFTMSEWWYYSPRGRELTTIVSTIIAASMASPARIDVRNTPIERGARE